MESRSAIDEGTIVQMLVVFVQLEPTKIDVDSEVVAIRKIGGCSFGGFKTLEKKFVRVDKVPACALEELAIMMIIIAASRKQDLPDTGGSTSVSSTFSRCFPCPSPSRALTTNWKSSRIS